MFGGPEREGQRIPRTDHTRRARYRFGAFDLKSELQISLESRRSVITLPTVDTLRTRPRHDAAGRRWYHLQGRMAVVKLVGWTSRGRNWGTMLQGRGCDAEGGTAVITAVTSDPRPGLRALVCGRHRKGVIRRRATPRGSRPGRGFGVPLVGAHAKGISRPV
jgi:hypothetical protein